MDLTIPLATLVLLVALALAFDFMNGFHDAANSIATIVSTGVLRPYQAVLWAAFFNFVAIFIFHLKSRRLWARASSSRRRSITT
jgi:inorganic phosphate transporter, PiT family